MKGGIIVCGDLHGDWGKLNELVSKRQPSIVLQCGDFGWWPAMSIKSSVVYHLKSWSHKGLKPQGAEIYWCDGNHEDHDDLEDMRWMNKNQVIECYPGVNYMPRGNTLRLPDGRVVLFIGGADSIDKDQRIMGIDWFPSELINNKDFERAMSHERVDIVISHTAPTEWIPDICRGDKFNDPSRVALSEILKYYKPDLWFNGHWHKEARGKWGKTRWCSLDYAGHSGRWWVQL